MNGLECIGGPFDGDIFVDSGTRLYVAMPPVQWWATYGDAGDETRPSDIRHGVYGKATRWKRYGVRSLPIEEVWLWEGEP